MTHYLKILANLFLSAVLLVSLTLLFSAQLLTATVFNNGFFQQVIVNTSYLPLVRQAIEQDLQAQASYIGVSDDVLSAGVNNDSIHLLLRNHIDNVASTLAGKSEFQTVEYPSTNFEQPLYDYLEKANTANGLQTTAEQLASVQTIAKEASNTVNKHVTLFNLERMARLNIVMTAIARTRQFSELKWLFLSLSIFSFGIIWLINRKNIRSALFFGFGSLWLMSSLFLIPAIVLRIMDLAQRLAIQTPYLKFAIDKLLSSANNSVLIWSLVIFLMASTALILTQLYTSSTVKAANGFTSSNINDSGKRR